VTGWGFKEAKTTPNCGLLVKRENGARKRRETMYKVNHSENQKPFYLKWNASQKLPKETQNKEAANALEKVTKQQRIKEKNKEQSCV